MTDDDRPLLGPLTGIRLAANGAFRFLYPFLPVVARDLGVSPARAGLLVSAIAVGGMSSPAVRRLLTGQHERVRRLLVLSAGILALGTVLAAGAPGMVVGLVGFLILGAGKPLLDAATIAYVAGRTPYARRARATGIMELTWAGALVLIAPIAGVVAGATSWRIPLAGLAALVLVLTLLTARLMTADHAPGPAASVAADAADTTPVRLGASARRFLLVVAFVFAALEGTFAVVGLWFEDAFGLAVEQLGAFVALSAIGELLGSTFVVVLADRIGKARAAFTGLAITAVGMLSLVWVSSLPWAVAALAIGLFGSETAIVASIPMGSEVAPEARSRFLVTMFGATSFTRAVVGGLGPALYAAVGIGGNVTMSVVAAGVAAALLTRTIRSDPRLAW